MARFSRFLEPVTAKRLASRFRTRRDRASGLPLPPIGLRAGGHHFRRDEDFVGSAGREVAFLIAHAGLGPGARVLDFGCGVGRLAFGLIGRFRDDVTYEGIDVMEAPIDWCRSAIAVPHPQYRFTRIDVRNDRYNPAGIAEATSTHLPFPPRSFDIVYGYSVFSHMRGHDVKAYLREFARLLAPDGCVVVTAFVEDAVDDEVVNPVGYGPLTWSGELHCVRFSRAYFDRSILEAGLTVLFFEHGKETDGQSRAVLGLEARGAGAREIADVRHRRSLERFEGSR